MSFDGRSILALTNVTVTGNSAEEAGGIDSYCEFELNNSIVALNTANGENGDIGGISGDLAGYFLQLCELAGFFGGTIAHLIGGSIA